MRRSSDVQSTRSLLPSRRLRRGRPVRSPAARAGLTVYVARLPSAPFSARVGVPESKMPDGLNHRAFCSGDVLLSHGLSPYYHRGCSVSLPCSEWERVGPLRYCHQSAEPHWRFAAIAARQADIGLWGLGRLSQSPLPKFRKNMIFNPHSAIENPQSILVL